MTNVVVGPSQIRGEFKTPQDGKKYFATTRVDPAVADELQKYGVEYSGSAGQNLLPRPPVLGASGADLLRDLGVFHPPHRRQAGPRRADERGALPREDLRREGDGRHLRRRGGRGRGQGRAEGDRQLPEGPGAAMAGSARACRRASCWSALPASARRCSRARSRARRACRSSRSPAPSSWRCSSASARARVRDLFEQARKMKPCIIFIDELDSLGRTRAAGAGGGGNDEKEQTLNQLLAELDGFDPREGIVLLAATNRPEILDPALTRAGRFDRQVALDRPDKPARIAILQGAYQAGEGVAGSSIWSRWPRSRPAFPARTSRTSSTRRRLSATRRGGDAGHDGRFHARRGAPRRRHREALAHLVAEGAQGGRLSRDGPCARRVRAAGRGPGAQGVHHPARHWRARLHHAAPDRGSLPDRAPAS